jgi:hypothetical protein
MSLLSNIKNFFLRIKMVFEPVFGRLNALLSHWPIAKVSVYLFLFYFISFVFFDRLIVSFFFGLKGRSFLEFFTFFYNMTLPTVLYTIVVVGYLLLMILAGISLTEEKFERYNSWANKFFVILKSMFATHIALLIFKILLFRSDPQAYFEKSEYTINFLNFSAQSAVFSLYSALIIAVCNGFYKLAGQYKSVIYSIGAFFVAAGLFSGEVFLSDLVAGAYIALLIGKYYLGLDLLNFSKSFDKDKY